MSDVRTIDGVPCVEVRELHGLIKTMIAFLNKPGVFEATDQCVIPGRLFEKRLRSIIDDAENGG